MMHSKHNKLSHYFKIIILIVEVVFILFRFAFIHKQFWRFLQVWKLLWHYNIHFSKRYVVNLTSWPLSSCSFTASKKVFLLFGFSFSVLFNSKMFLILFFLRIFFISFCVSFFTSWSDSIFPSFLWDCASPPSSSGNHFPLWINTEKRAKHSSHPGLPRQHTE